MMRTRRERERDGGYGWKSLNVWLRDKLIRGARDQRQEGDEGRDGEMRESGSGESKFTGKVDGN